MKKNFYLEILSRKGSLVEFKECVCVCVCGNIILKQILRMYFVRM